MIPEIISPEIKSNAEKKVFAKFREAECDETIVILHSLGVAEHSNNIFGEIDFVIICKEGILCVEVKGGAVERRNAHWIFTNRYGKRETKLEGPFVQVQGNMHSLRSYLKKRLGNQSPIVRCQFASCVIMPDCNFNFDGIDIIREVLFDSSFEWTLSDIIRQSFLYWRERCNRQYGFTGGTLTEQEILHTVELLRGDFRFIPSLKEFIDRVAQELCALTDEQYEVLEALGDNKRILVSGMAGTGKTLLAMEQCRRAFWSGKNTLYLCYNHKISQYVKRRFARESLYIEVSTLHALMMDLCGETWSPDKDSEYYSYELPKLFIDQKDICKKYDMVVIDEGQDLLNNIYLKCIDVLINGGLMEGNWSIFFDPNQNIFNPKSELNTLLPELSKVAACFNLTVNCRNTKQIANANTLITNMPQAGRVKATGPNVEYFKYSSLSEEISLVIELLQKLKTDGISCRDVVLLSAYTIENPRCCLFHGKIPAEVGKIKIDGFIWQAKNNELRFSTVSSFKGLESKIVILMDVDAFVDEQRRLLHYVAISRACTALYVFYDASAEDERQIMLAKGYLKLVQ
jgi:hypothetical protein